MADYIKSPVLFESYVHLDGNYDDIEDAVESLRRHINDYIEERAKHFLYSNVTSEVKFKEGSIKAYATVRGTLRQCIPEYYADFSKEIDHLYWFAKRLSDAAVMEVAFKTGAYLRAIERTEARPGIIGRTKKVTDGLLSIHSVDTEKAANGTVRRLKIIHSDIRRLTTMLRDFDDRELVQREFLQLLSYVPTRLGTKNVSEATEIKYREVVDGLNEALSSMPLVHADPDDDAEVDEA